MRMLIAACIALVAVTFPTNTTFAGSPRVDKSLGPIVYRDTDGHLAGNSVSAAKQMGKLARKQGYVTLWITLNFDFDLNLNEKTDEAEIAAQDRAVRTKFDELLNPLVVRGMVWHPIAGPYVRGPGCFVRANTEGVRHLVDDNRLVQIVSSN